MIDVEYHNQHGDLVGIETYTGFGYRREGRRHDATAARSCSATSRSATRCPSSRSTSPPTTVVLGALASRDWRPMHHDYKFATERNGVADIFLNTPNQAAWFERYVTDWTGPHGRLGRMTFRMRDSVFPGDRMVFAGHGHRASTPTTPAAAGSTSTSRSPSSDAPCCTDVRRVLAVAVPTTPTTTPGRAAATEWKP